MDILTLTLFSQAPGNQQSTTMLTSAGQQIRFSGSITTLGPVRGAYASAEDVAEQMPFRNAKITTTDLSPLSPEEVEIGVAKWIRTKVKAGFVDAHLMYSEVSDRLFLNDLKISEMMNKYRETPINSIPDRRRLTDFIRQHRTIHAPEGSCPCSDTFERRMAEVAHYFVDDYRTGFDYDLFFYDSTVPNPIRNATP